MNSIRNIFLNKNYFKKIMKKIFLIALHPFFAAFHQFNVSKYGNQALRHQPIFIIGAPRTGSTILYQALTSAFDVSYIDNLACIFHRTLFFGMWLSHVLYRGKQHGNFKAYHGNTSKFGMHAPSECGGFWYKWLPKDRHFIRKEDVAEKDLLAIKKEVTAIINYFDKPIIFKNMNAALRLDMLKEIFPNAKFIWIKRDPVFVASSLLKVRQKVFGDISKWWSLMPQNIKNLLSLSPCEQVVDQIYYIEKQITHDIANFDGENVLIIQYEKLGDLSFYDEIQKKFLLKRILNFDMAFIFKNNKQEELIKEIQVELISLVQKRDWHGYTS